MEISFSADIDVSEDSQLRLLIFDLKIREFFESKDYGNNSVSLFFVINCLKFQVKNRTKFSKKDSVLYWDIILDYNTIMTSTLSRKKNMLANAIIESFDVLDKYKSLKVEKKAIQNDLERWFRDTNWL